MATVLQLNWMLVPFLACLVLSGILIYLGLHVIARKVIFVDLALAQIAAFGATYALTLGYDPNAEPLTVLLFSLAFTFVGAGAFAIARMRKEKVPQEAFIGIIYAAASAAAILTLSKSPTGGEELKHMLVGDILLVSFPTVMRMALLYIGIGIFHLIFWKKFLAISLDPERVEAAGTNIRLWDFIFYVSFGVVIVESVAVAGVLLVFSYLVVPAVIAQMFSATITGRLLLGWLAALIASMLGIVWSFYSDYPTGPAVVVMLAIVLILASMVYYLQSATNKGRAVANLAGLILCSFIFFAGLSAFKKPTPAVTLPKAASIDQLLEELKEGEEAHQLGAIAHLNEMRDPKIALALADLLLGNPSEQIVEAAVGALKKQNDPRTVPALRNAAQGNYDSFLKLSIAQTQLALGDRQGFSTLVAILKSEGPSVARQQASDLLEKLAGRKFGYQAENDIRQNDTQLGLIDAWLNGEGKSLLWDAKAGQFRPQK